MEKTIRSLISLQNCDLQSDHIKQKMANIPARIKILKEALAHTEKQMEEALSSAESVKQEKRQIEREIEDLDNGILKSKGKLDNIKSNKEYTAALKEIADLERQKLSCEDKLLEIMGEADAMVDKCKAIEEEREASRKKFEADQNSILKEMEAMEQELKDYDAESTSIRKEIAESLLKNYDSIKAHKEGMGLSAVIKGICQGCHMGIPPQKFNELMRGDSLMNCPHCMRIIYWGEDERYQDINSV